MRPGSLSRQYNVCGKPGCPLQRPQEAAPAWPLLSTQLRLWWKKRPPSSVRPRNLKQVRTQLATYKRFRRLTDQWIGSALKLAKLPLEK